MLAWRDRANVSGGILVSDVRQKGHRTEFAFLGAYLQYFMQRQSLVLTIFC
jgi:hypothetical protein